FWLGRKMIYQSPVASSSGLDGQPISQMQRR
ncbi:hypothetical protein ABH927_006358, partial [Planotetraspora sp. GP83]